MGRGRGSRRRGSCASRARAAVPAWARGRGSARDLARRQSAYLAQRQRHARLFGERRVAAREHEREPVVRDRRHVVLLGAQLLQSRQQLRLAGERALAPDAVDRTVAGGGDDPGGGIPRGALAGPAFECGRERVLHRVLGELEVAEDANQDRDGPAPLLAEDRLDGGHCSTSGRISTEPFSATGMRDAISIASSRSVQSAMK